ncbi:MAG: hypothetical protein QOH06_885 [Acidobacteriota bacterium]|nr:hypothetical protein [Acidobacteriota bacterium]
MEPPRQPRVPEGIRQLIGKVVTHRFLLMMTFFFFSGLLLIRKADSGDLMRDIGIGLFVAGTVGLGVEWFVRKEMEMEFRAGFDESIEKLRDLQADASTRVDEIRHLLWNNNLREMGVRQIYASRDKAEFVEWLTSAVPGSTVRLMALCLNPATVSDKLILKKLRQGCKIKLLLLDPYSSPLDQRAREEAQGKEETFKARVRQWAATHQEFIDNLEPDLPGSLELGFYVAAPACFIAENESSMLVGFYLNNCRGDDCPHLELEVKPGGAYEAFRRHFDSLWAQRIPKPDRRRETRKVEKDRRGMRAVRAATSSP